MEGGASFQVSYKPFIFGPTFSPFTGPCYFLSLTPGVIQAHRTLLASLCPQCDDSPTFHIPQSSHPSLPVPPLVLSPFSSSLLSLPLWAFQGDFRWEQRKAHTFNSLRPPSSFLLSKQQHTPNTGTNENNKCIHQEAFLLYRWEGLEFLH